MYRFLIFATAFAVGAISPIVANYFTNKSDDRRSRRANMRANLKSIPPEEHNPIIDDVWVGPMPSGLY